MSQFNVFTSREKIDEFIHSQSSSLSCRQPKLPVFSPEMMKFVHEVPPIDCSSAGVDWVKCEVNTVFFLAPFSNVKIEG